MEKFQGTLTQSFGTYFPEGAGLEGQYSNTCIRALEWTDSNSCSWLQIQTSQQNADVFEPLAYKIMTPCNVSVCGVDSKANLSVKLSNGQRPASIFPGQRVSCLLFRLVEPHTEPTNQPLTVFLPLSSVQITCQRFPPRDSAAPIPKLTDRKLIMPFLTFSACVRLCRSMCKRIVVFFPPPTAGHCAFSSSFFFLLLNLEKVTHYNESVCLCRGAQMVQRSSSTASQALSGQRAVKNAPHPDPKCVFSWKSQCKSKKIVRCLVFIKKKCLRSLGKHFSILKSWN